MQHFEGILSSQLMCTTCCTTRSLNRPFVSHPPSRVTVFLNYLLCCTTISIVSCRVEPWFLFKTRIVQLYHPASSAACGVGKHKQITNVASGDGPLESRRVSSDDAVLLVGTVVKKLDWLIFLWFIAAFCASAPSASALASRPAGHWIDRTDWWEVNSFYDVLSATDAATSLAALLQQWSSSAGTSKGRSSASKKAPANVFILKSITDMTCWYKATCQIVLHGPLFRLSICCWLCNSFHKPWCCPLSHVFKWLQETFTLSEPKQRWLQTQLGTRKKSELVQVKISHGMIKFCRHIKTPTLNSLGCLGPNEAKMNRHKEHCCRHTLHEMNELLKVITDSDTLWIGLRRLNSHLRRKSWRVDGDEIWKLSHSLCCLRPAQFATETLRFVASLSCSSPQWDGEQAAIISVLQVWHCWTYVTVTVCQPQPLRSSKMFPLSAGCKAPEKWIRVILCPDRGRGGGRRKRRNSVFCQGGLALSRSVMATSIMTI